MVKSQAQLVPFLTAGTDQLPSSFPTVHGAHGARSSSLKTFSCYRQCACGRGQSSKCKKTCRGCPGRSRIRAVPAEELLQPWGKWPSIPQDEIREEEISRYGPVWWEEGTLELVTSLRYFKIHPNVSIPKIEPQSSEHGDEVTWMCVMSIRPLQLHANSSTWPECKGLHSPNQNLVVQPSGRSIPHL